MIDQKIKEYNKIIGRSAEETRKKQINFYFTNYQDDGKRFASDSIFAESYALFENGIQPLFKQKDYKTQILLVGFSIQPIILSILALKAKRIIFIYSEDTKGECSRIQELIPKITKFLGLDIEYEFVGQNERFKNNSIYSVDSSDPADTYKKVNAIIKSEIGNNISLSKICLNLTGGKKSMSNGAYIAANINKVDTYYVDFRDYDNDRPLFGTENLIALPLIVEIESLKSKSIDEKKSLSPLYQDYVETS